MTRECIYCLKIKQLEQFKRDNRRTPPYCTSCKECTNNRLRMKTRGETPRPARKAAKYGDTPEGRKASAIARKLENKIRVNAIKLERGCEICNLVDSYPEVFDFHHVRGEKKESVAKMIQYSFKQILAEIAKCICVCSNCHRRLHADARRTGGV